MDEYPPDLHMVVSMLFTGCLTRVQGELEEYGTAK